MVNQTPIHFDVSKLKPVINETGFNLHYNGIYKEFVDNVNKSSGDIPYNRAGEFLHKLYFENIREFRQNNEPTGKIQHIIQLRYGSYENFQKTIEDQGSRIQGNGWLFMNSAGYINIIPNNRIVDNIALIIDVWEHAYSFTYGIDKNKYLKDCLSIIDWDVVNKRILESKKDEK